MKPSTKKIFQVMGTVLLWSVVISYVVGLCTLIFSPNDQRLMKISLMSLVVSSGLLVIWALLEEKFDGR